MLPSPFLAYLRSPGRAARRKPDFDLFKPRQRSERGRAGEKNLIAATQGGTTPTPGRCPAMGLHGWGGQGGVVAGFSHKAAAEAQDWSGAVRSLRGARPGGETEPAAALGVFIISGGFRANPAAPYKAERGEGLAAGQLPKLRVPRAAWAVPNVQRSAQHAAMLSKQ